MANPPADFDTDFKTKLAASIESLQGQASGYLDLEAISYILRSARRRHVLAAGAIADVELSFESMDLAAKYTNLYEGNTSGIWGDDFVAKYGEVTDDKDSWAISSKSMDATRVANGATQFGIFFSSPVLCALWLLV